MKALIIDDEIRACENISHILKKLMPNLSIIGIAQSTKLAELIMSQQTPDVLFIDIEMPEENGIEFIARIQPVSFEIVFVTAYNEFAIKAFKLNALDYILKPLNETYVQKTIDRLKHIIELKENNTGAIHPAINYTNKELLNKIAIRDGYHYWKIDFNDIFHLASEDGYTTFYVLFNGKLKKILSSYGLKHYEDILPNYFIRIHKSYIINKNKIKQVIFSKTEYNVLLSSNIQIPISRRKLKEFKDIFQFFF